MRARIVLIGSVVLLLAGLGSAVLVARAANASNGEQARVGPRGQQFVGYWMGVDPLDGGDARRGITRNPDGTFSVIGRDTVFTLCDNTDRALITLHDRELDRLRDSDRKLVRQLQRQYMEVWVEVLTRRYGGLDEAQARAAVHAVFGLLNSTPHSASHPSAALLGRAAMAQLLHRLALGAFEAAASGGPSG